MTMYDVDPGDGFTESITDGRDIQERHGGTVPTRM